VSLTVLESNQPVVGVSIHVNGNIKTITNEQGKARLSNLSDGDTIHTACLGYKSETIIFSSQTKELTINLTRKIFDLDGVVVSSKNDRSLFKKMLKWGLQESTVYKPIPFLIRDSVYLFSKKDTVYRQRTGNFMYPVRGRECIVKKAQTEVFYATSGINKENQQKNHAKISKSKIEICLTFLYGLVNFNKDMKMIYMGKDSQKEVEQFYFYIPNNNWIHATTSRNKAYCGGIVYLDSEGIINKIKVHTTALDSSIISYEYDIDYVYDKKKNEVIPYRAIIQNHEHNEELEIILTRRSYLEIYSKQAILAGLVEVK
jgi:hypothetical protein